MTESKYAIEKRVGCIAVIDTTIGRPGPGLHRDDRDVVGYWSGYWRQGCWHVSRKSEREAKRFIKEQG